MASHLVVDNYDSFTYNLVHILEDLLQEDLEVKRVDDVDPNTLHQYRSVVLSPGPGLPEESRNLMPIVEKLLDSGQKTLGVCLGMQALALAGGMKLKNLKDVHHGVSHQLIKPEPSARLYADIAQPLMVGRYHSWVIDENTMTDEWMVTGRDSDGEIMSMEHRFKKLYAIQFHPESVLTPQGRSIIGNYLRA